MAKLLNEFEINELKKVKFSKYISSKDATKNTDPINFKHDSINKRLKLVKIN